MFISRKNKGYYVRVKDTLICGDEIIPILDGIPRFVNDKSYASLFGYQWKQYRKTQLDSYTGTSISRKRLERCLGDELSKNLAGKLVLEAGCGAGRFTEILLEKKAVLVSSDISTAVEANKANFPVTNHHQVIQADINDMPFENGTFDVVICMGVIQHTPDSEKTIKNLYELVKAGGCLIIDHYTLSRSSLFRLATIYRWFLKRKPADKTIPYTRRLVKRYLPLHKKFANNKIASVLLNRISPVISYYRAFPELSDEHQEQWALLDTHDSLTDWYKRFRTKGSILRTLQKLGAANIWCNYGGNGVEARCKKPL
jgi:SAM-dependent methyltransferase